MASMEHTESAVAEETSVSTRPMVQDLLMEGAWMKALNAQYFTFAETETAVIQAMEDLHRGGLSFDTVFQKAQAPQKLIGAVRAGVENSDLKYVYDVDSRLYTQAFLKFIEARFLDRFGRGGSEHDGDIAYNFVRHYFIKDQMAAYRLYLNINQHKEKFDREAFTEVELMKHVRSEADDLVRNSVAAFVRDGNGRWSDILIGEYSVHHYGSTHRIVHSYHSKHLKWYQEMKEKVEGWDDTVFDRPQIGDDLVEMFVTEPGDTARLIVDYVRDGGIPAGVLERAELIKSFRSVIESGDVQPVDLTAEEWLQARDRWHRIFDAAPSERLSMVMDPETQSQLEVSESESESPSSSSSLSSSSVSVQGAEDLFPVLLSQKHLSASRVQSSLEEIALLFNAHLSYDHQHRVVSSCYPERVAGSIIAMCVCLPES